MINHSTQIRQGSGPLFQQMAVTELVIDYECMFVHGWCIQSRKLIGFQFAFRFRDEVKGLVVDKDGQSFFTSVPAEVEQRGVTLNITQIISPPYTTTTLFVSSARGEVTRYAIVYSRERAEGGQERKGGQEACTSHILVLKYSTDMKGHFIDIDESEEEMVWLATKEMGFR